MNLADDKADRPDLILSGSYEGARYRFRLVEGGNSVGSRVENRICLDVPGISKHHAVVRLNGRHVSVEDLASKNGTQINGRRIQVAKLEVGDTLAFASLSLRLEQSSGDDGRLAISLENSRISAAESAFQETPRIDEDRLPPSRADGPPDLVFPRSWLPGKSPSMSSFLAQMRPLVDSSLPVLILGETGSGKEGVARTIHLSSPRAKKNFVAINCAAIPEDLLEAELFGIGRGVATGVESRTGRFVEARGGTLFLDEIGDMPATLQAKLLRFLQEGEIQPLGLPPRVLEVRVIAATHTDLAAAMVSGRFRRDLFYRLAGAALHLPSLRQRREDIPDLIALFLTQATREAVKDVRGFTVDAMQLSSEYPWPGNVRQLQHAVERWVHQCPEHQVIDAEHVASDLASSIDEVGATPERSVVEVRPAKDVGSGFDPRTLPSLNLASVEKGLIREALRREEGNLTKAAELLGLTRQALRRRIARHRLGDSENS